MDIVGKYVERMMQGYRIKAFEGDQENTDDHKVGDWGSLQWGIVNIFNLQIFWNYGQSQVSARIIIFVMNFATPIVSGPLAKGQMKSNPHVS